MNRDRFSESDIAIIGMAGHFPGAADVDKFWERVSNGDDCLRDLSPEDLSSRGVSARDVDSTTYVRRAGVLDGVEDFDSDFFGISRRDAALMDPQHRHFLECSWDALEAGGIVPERFDGAIGVFGGCGMNTYLIHNLLPNSDLVDDLGWFLLRHTGNDKDFLTTTVSYRLDLRGPSINVQTACSTSLVAVHMAVQSLLSMECDVALAGGSTIEVPHGVGYQFHPGEILSPDGRCRAFDGESAGTVLASGAGVVALRRLTDAWDSGDPILAVIKGSAVNNDGARKVSYLAPSVDGHADAVKEALTVAGLNARDIQLLEAHGTGTPVGDPIEVAALTEAFGAFTGDTGFCRLSSTKPNVGHLDTAAGVASLIKVVQALRHETLPPIANHTGPSPLLDLAHTPFVLSADRSPWPDDRPRRAGVSSLGVGGTNAHVVVEEAPRRPLGPADPEQVLAISGRDAKSVADAALRLASHLEAHPDLELADVAHTLATRRRRFPVRRVITATDTRSAITQLASSDRIRSFEHQAQDVTPRVAFLFPGGGSQYPAMARGLDHRFSSFHDVVSDGIARVRDLSGVDLGELLRSDRTDAELNAPTVALPAVFLTSLGLARQWLDWGVQPDAYIGHSLGEYVAAHLAGVLTFDDALRLVVARAALMERVGGHQAAMLVVPFGEADTRRLLIEGVSLAVVNTDDECVIAGRSREIAETAGRLESMGTPGTLIPLAAAAHSLLLDPVLDDFRAVVATTTLSQPTARYMSNLTGTWITPEQATDTDYWVQHLRDTVRYADNLRAALGEAPTVTVELGPGQSLSSYARRCAHAPVAAIPALRHARQKIDDTAFTLQAFAQQWATGVPVGLERLTGGGRQSLTLPTYPFQRSRHWIDAPAGEKSRPRTVASDPPSDEPVQPATAAAVELHRFDKPSEMWWEPGWESAGAIEPNPGPWRRWHIVSAGGNPLAARISDELIARGFIVNHLDATRLVNAGEVDLGLADDDGILLVGASSTDSIDVDAAAAFWLGTGLDATRAIGNGLTAGHRFVMVTSGAFGVEQAAVRPTDAMAVGLTGVIPHEYPDLDTLLIDAPPDDVTDAAAVADELVNRGADRIVAFREGRRLVPTLRHTGAIADEDTAASFVEGGSYLVTGGLGAIGHSIAMHLASRGAHLAVVTSSELPPADERSAWRLEHGPMDPTSVRLRRLAELETRGAHVQTIVADLSRPQEVVRALDEAERALGRLDGAVHAAGTLRDRLIAMADADDIETVVGVKARGGLTLTTELERRGADLLVLVSSTSTVLAPAGQVAYVASNAVLDALAGRRGDLRVVTLNYGIWSGIGMAHEAAERLRHGSVKGTPVVHPVFEERVARGDATVVVSGHLSTTHHWMLDEHRTKDNHALLPGTGHLELLASAASLARASENPTLSAVTIHEAVVLRDDRPTPIRVRIVDGPDGTTLALETESAAACGWTLHSSALLVTDTHAMSVLETRDRANFQLLDPFASQQHHLRLGPRWHPSASGTTSDNTTRATLALTHGTAEDCALWRAHPALVDAATGLAAELVRAETGNTDLLVPIAYDRVSFHGTIPSHVEAVVTMQPAGRGTARKLDIRLFDQSGQGVLDIEGLQLWPVASGAALRRTDFPEPESVRATSFAEFADDLGIRPPEGVALLEQLLTSGRSRLVASSVDLDGLRSRLSHLTDPPSHDTTAALAPRVQSTTVLDHISMVWADMLGVRSVEPDDNFFDLGGHSLIAIRVMSRLQRDLGVRLQLVDILEAPNLADLSARVSALMPSNAPPAEGGHSDVVAASGSQPRHRSLVMFSAGGPESRLFIVHGAGGTVMFLWNLARALSDHHSVFGFQAMGVDGTELPDSSVEAMAARYVDELRAAHAGPYLLGGYSGGGTIALEMVRQLQTLGDTVSHVVLFDSVPPGCLAPNRATRAWNLLVNIRSCGLKAVRPYLRWRALLAADGFKNDDADDRVVDLEDAEGHVDLFTHISECVDRYAIDQYVVDATVIKADNVWPIQPRDYYWSRHVRGNLAIRTVPGDHRSMFDPQLVSQLADIVRAALAPWRPSVTNRSNGDR